jgi:molybdopterin synthase catalytic subunit
VYSRIQIQEVDFSVDDVLSELKHASGAVGGICTFTGSVRDVNDDESVTSLFLEHYPGMTEKQLAKILQAASARFSMLGVVVIHRVGQLTPGDNIVLVAVASAHRGDAFEACHFVMDYLKTQATFWKREQRGSGGEQWLAMRGSDQAAQAVWETVRDTKD